MILMAYRHGLRVGELTALRWKQVDLGQGLLHVRRLKHGTPSTHPLHGRELRALRRLQREHPESAGGACSAVARLQSRSPFQHKLTGWG